MIYMCGSRRENIGLAEHIYENLSYITLPQLNGWIGGWVCELKEGGGSFREGGGKKIAS